MHNAMWKLALCVRGLAGWSLLKTYEDEEILSSLKGRGIASLKGRGIVIPEGAGHCQGVFCLVPTSMWTALNRTPVSRWSARSAARTSDLDGGVGEVQRALGQESKPGIGMWLWCNVSIVMRMRLGRAEISAAGHPFAPRYGGMERCACSTRDQSSRRPRRDTGVRQLHDRARVASEMLTLPGGGPARGCVRRAARSRRG